MKITQHSLPQGSTILYNQLGETTISEFIVTEWSKKGHIRMSDDDTRGTWWTRDQVEKLYILEVIKPPGYEPPVSKTKQHEYEQTISDLRMDLDDQRRSVQNLMSDRDSYCQQAQNARREAQVISSRFHEAWSKSQHHEPLMTVLRHLLSDMDDGTYKVADMQEQIRHAIKKVEDTPKRHPFWARGGLANIPDAELEKILNDCLAHNKINAIKAVRQHSMGYGLADSKEIVEKWMAGEFDYQPPGATLPKVV